MSPIRPDALWAMDFQLDHTINGRIVEVSATPQGLDIAAECNLSWITTGQATNKPTRRTGGLTTWSCSRC